MGGGGGEVEVRVEVGGRVEVEVRVGWWWHRSTFPLLPYMYTNGSQLIEYLAIEGRLKPNKTGVHLSECLRQ